MNQRTLNLGHMLDEISGGDQYVVGEPIPIEPLTGKAYLHNEKASYP